MTMLNGVSTATRKRPKPPAVITSRMRALAGLCAQRQPHLLIQRRRHAERSREGIVDAADRMQVLLQASPAAGSTINRVPLLVQRGAYMGDRAHWIAQVVQTVEEGDQVVPVAGKLLGGGNLEGDIVDAGLGGQVTGTLDGRRVEVKP